MILDACAVLAWFLGEPAATVVGPALRRGDVALTAVGHAEVIDQRVRIGGIDEEEAVLDMYQLGLAPAIPVDEVLATHAATLRARHYHRRARPVSLADCLAAAVARSHGRPLMTSDAALLDLCVEEGIAHLAIADSTGTIWRAT